MRCILSVENGTTWLCPSFPFLVQVLSSLEQGAHGVMVGRSWSSNPWYWSQADSKLFGTKVISKISAIACCFVEHLNRKTAAVGSRCRVFHAASTARQPSTRPTAPELTCTLQQANEVMYNATTVGYSRLLDAVFWQLLRSIPRHAIGQCLVPPERTGEYVSMSPLQPLVYPGLDPGARGSCGPKIPPELRTDILDAG